MSKLLLDDARRIAINCASKYNTSLENKQFIIIYRDKETNEVRHIEVVFLARNYQHLTGINLIGENGKEVNHQSEYFYKKCLKKKLSKDEIALKNNMYYESGFIILLFIIAFIRTFFKNSLWYRCSSGFQLAYRCRCN